MDLTRARSNTRSLLGLAAVSLAIGAVIVFAPRSPQPEPERAWQPPAGYATSDTVSLSNNRTLRLWTASSGWYVESLASGRHEAAIGASDGGDEYSVSVVLDGLVGYVPIADAQAVSVTSQGATVRADVHARVFLVPASVIAVTDVAVLVTPLDRDGRPLTGATLVPIAGRT